MSNLWFNIRFGTYFLQIGPNNFDFAQNAYQQVLKETDPNWKWFAVYEFFGVMLDFELF